MERFPGEGKGYPLQYSGLENWGRKELDTTERLSLSFFPVVVSGKFTLSMPRGEGLSEEVILKQASQVALAVKNPPANAGDMGSISESRRSPGKGNGNPLQYSFF